MWQKVRVSHLWQKLPPLSAASCQADTTAYHHLQGKIMLAPTGVQRGKRTNRIINTTDGHRPQQERACAHQRQVHLLPQRFTHSPTASQPRSKCTAPAMPPAPWPAHIVNYVYYLHLHLHGMFRYGARPVGAVWACGGAHFLV